MAIRLEIEDIDVDGDKIIKKRGFSKNGLVTKYVLSEVERLSKNIIPTGNTMKLQSQVEVNDEYIHYKSPYSRYQFYGKVMTGKAPKKVTNRNLKYKGKGQSKWAFKTWTANKDRILKDIERGKYWKKKF